MRRQSCCSFPPGAMPSRASDSRESAVSRGVRPRAPHLPRLRPERAHGHAAARKRRVRSHARPPIRARTPACSRPAAGRRPRRHARARSGEPRIRGKRRRVSHPPPPPADRSASHLARWPPRAWRKRSRRACAAGHRAIHAPPCANAPSERGLRRVCAASRGSSAI